MYNKAKQKKNKAFVPKQFKNHWVTEKKVLLAPIAPPPT